MHFGIYCFIGFHYVQYSGKRQNGDGETRLRFGAALKTLEISLLSFPTSVTLSHVLQCLAMAALRRIAIPQDNRHLLVEAGILAMLARAGRSGEVEIQREVTEE